MVIDRRTSLRLMAAACGWTVVASARASAETAGPHPALWRIEAGGARVFVFGIGDARDRSWLTPQVEQAFQDSQEIWFETPQAGSSAPAGPPPPTAQPAVGPARNLFDVLDPELSARVLATAARYGIPRDRLGHVRPWQAYFVLNSGFVAHSMPASGAATNAPDAVLAQMALKTNKTVRSEFPTFAQAMAHFINMPEAEASQRLEFLLDFIDDDAAGRRADRYDWIQGRTSTRLIDRMRRKWPALYRDEQVERNVAWARRIQGFLIKGGTYFVAIGLQHTLGRDNVLNKVRELGLRPLRV